MPNNQAVVIPVELLQARLKEIHTITREVDAIKSIIDLAPRAIGVDIRLVVKCRIDEDAVFYNFSDLGIRGTTLAELVPQLRQRLEYNERMLQDLTTFIV